MTEQSPPQVEAGTEEDVRKDPLKKLPGGRLNVEEGWLDEPTPEETAETFKTELELSIVSGDKKTARYKTSERLREDFHFVCMRDNERIYRYNHKEGIFLGDGLVLAKEKIRQYWGKEATSHDINEILAMLKQISYTDRDSFGIEPGKIVLINGVLDLETLELYNHAPSFRALKKVDCSYQPEATCLRFLNFLSHTMPDQQDRIRLQELLGTALLNKKVHKKGGVIVGPTDSGKTTLIEVIQGVFGKKNTSDLGPREMGERWGKPKLESVLLNLTHEVDGEKRLERLDIIKKILDGNPITVERKGEEPYEIEPTCEHLFAANQTPSANRKDDAFWNRWIVMEMPITIPEKKQDKELVDKLLEEKSGIFNWMLEGYVRFKANSLKFTQNQPWMDARDKWLTWGNSIQRFIQNCIRKAEGRKITTSKLHELYSFFSEELDLDVESQKKLTEEVRNVRYAIYSNNFVIDGRKQRGFKNIEVILPAQKTGDERDAQNSLFN